MAIKHFPDGTWVADTPAEAAEFLKLIAATAPAAVETRRRPETPAVKRNDGRPRWQSFADRLEDVDMDILRKLKSVGEVSTGELAAMIFPENKDKMALTNRLSSMSHAARAAGLDYRDVVAKRETGWKANRKTMLSPGPLLKENAV